MDTLAMRIAGSDDIELLLPLVAEFCAIDQHPFDERFVRRALGPLLESDDLGIVWLIDEPPQGYAVLTWSYSLESGGRDALLDEIYLRQRGCGIGSRALRVILDELGERGLTRIFLETEEHNHRARRFYCRNGFVQERSVWMSGDL